MRYAPKSATLHIGTFVIHPASWAQSLHRLRAPKALAPPIGGDNITPALASRAPRDDASVEPNQVSTNSNFRREKVSAMSRNTLKKIIFRHCRPRPVRSPGQGGSAADCGTVVVNGQGDLSVTFPEWRVEDHLAGRPAAQFAAGNRKSTRFARRGLRPNLHGEFFRNPGDGLGLSPVVVGDGREALQQSSKRGPRSCSPIQPRDLLDERNERPGVDGRRTTIGQFSRRSDRRGLVPAPRSN